MAGRHNYLVSRYLNQITVRMGGAVGCHGYFKGMTFNWAIFGAVYIHGKPPEKFQSANMTEGHAIYFIKGFCRKYKVCFETKWFSL